MPSIAKQIGREAFGLDPSGYHLGRPAYPDWTFETLQTRCGLGTGTRTFEIGAGTGTATRALLDLGADPLTAIEPDPRLAEFLSAQHRRPSLTVLNESFEGAELEQAAYDLGVCATAFHWLEEGAALRKIASLLRPGGWWAAIWNVFGDDSRPDAFHEATKALLSSPTNPAMGEQGVPFGLDTEARLTAIRSTRAFDEIECMTQAWSLVLNERQTAALYATFSTVTVRPDRDAVLTELGRITRDQFGGRVVRNMTTSLYIARRSQPRAGESAT